MMGIQNQYWAMMTDKKFEIFYLDEHYHKYVKTKRLLKLATIILSYSSITAWIVWSNCVVIWAIIIFVVQGIQILDNHFPYNRRIIEISALNEKLEVLYNDIEYDWLIVSKGQLTEKDINDKIRSYKNKWSEINKDYFKNNFGGAINE